MRSATLAACVMGMAAVSVPGVAAAHIRKERTRVSGTTAAATWSYQVDDIATYLSVVVSEDDLASDGHPQRFATLTLLRSNVVTGHVLVAGVADLSDLDFTVDPKLSRAHLHAEGLFEDDTTLTFFPIALDLTWTATAPLAHQSSHDAFREPGFAIKTRFTGPFRDATATGSISGDDTELVLGPPESAQLQRNDAGSLSIVISKCGER
jgi:hypothetical protein